MKYLTFIFLYFLVCKPIFSQPVDSVTKLISQFDYQGALRQIEKADTGAPDYHLIYLKAVSLKALSKFPEALVCYDSIYKSDSNNVGVLIEMADCCRSLMDYQRTGELYEKALRIRPDNAYIMQLWAGLLVSMEKFREAGELYRSACAKDTSGFLLKQIGLCYEKIMEDELAIAYYEKAIKWSPNDYQPVFRLANLYKNKLEFTLGIAITDTFLSGGHVSRDIVRLSGYLHYLNQDFTGAVNKFQKSLEIGDSSMFVWKYLGYSYFKNNDFANTIRYLDKVFRVDSSDAELCYALALSHDVPENLRYFYAAINLTSPAIPILSDLYRDLSLALTKDQKYDEALNALMKALELTPRDASLIYKMAIHYDNWMDDKMAALKYYRDFMATRTNANDPFIVTAGAIIDQDDYRHAEMRITDIEKKFHPPVTVNNDTTGADLENSQNNP